MRSLLRVFLRGCLGRLQFILRLTAYTAVRDLIIDAETQLDTAIGIPTGFRAAISAVFVSTGRFRCDVTCAKQTTSRRGFPVTKATLGR
jgi:hypothetical protein